MSILFNSYAFKCSYFSFSFLFNDYAFLFNNYASRSAEWPEMGFGTLGFVIKFFHNVLWRAISDSEFILVFSFVMCFGRRCFVHVLWQAS